MPGALAQGEAIAEAIKGVYTPFDGALLGSIVSYWFAGPQLEEGRQMSDWAEAAVPLGRGIRGCAKLGKDGLVYPYLDKLAKPPVWTRAYGRTYGISKDSPPISKDEAKLELQEGLARYAASASSSRRAGESPGVPRCSRFLGWNCGVGAFRVSPLAPRDQRGPLARRLGVHQAASNRRRRRAGAPCPQKGYRGAVVCEGRREAGGAD